MITNFKPIALKKSYFFIPLSEQDFEHIKNNLITFNRSPEKHKDMFIEGLVDIVINHNKPIRYSEIIAVGDTDYNAKICTTVLDSYVFSTKYKGGYTKEVETAWQCFDNSFEDVNGIPYWKSGKNGITHPDAKVSWNCLMNILNRPNFGLIIRQR